MSTAYGSIPQPPPRNVRQEVAPKGGYARFNVSRNVPSTIGGRALPLLLGTTGLMIWGLRRVGKFNVMRRELKQEKKDIRLAIAPLLQAEEDARFVADREANRKQEAEVMKDVEGWKAGENVYKTRKFMPPATKGSMFQHDL